MSSTNSSSSGKDASAPATAAAGERVQLYLYDISQGMARALSPSLLGKQIEAIWHTGIVVYGYEYYYGGGIQYALPGQTVAGRPLRVVDLGVTQIPQDVFHEFLHSVSHRFTPATYSLLRHNCNNFTSECSKFLTGGDIPSYITGLPEEALNTPTGQMFRPFIEQMESQMRQGFTSGMVPWQENAAGGLALPTTKRTSTVTAATSSPQSVPPTSQPLAPAPAETKSAVLDLSSHRHLSLKLKAISKSNRPLVSSDQRQKTFEVLIKTYSGKMEPSLALTEVEKSALTRIVEVIGATGKAELPPNVFGFFERLLDQWPAKQLVPVLGLARLLLLDEAVAREVMKQFSQNQGMLPRLISISKKGGPAAVSSPSQIMALCCISNLFSSPEFAKILVQDSQISTIGIDHLESSEQSLRLTSASLLYNCSLFFDESNDHAVSVSSALCRVLENEKHRETGYRMLLALGHTMFCNDEISVLVHALEFLPSKVCHCLKSQASESTDVEITSKIEAACSDIQLMLSCISEMNDM